MHQPAPASNTAATPAGGRVDATPAACWPTRSVSSSASAARGFRGFAEDIVACAARTSPRGCAASTPQQAQPVFRVCDSKTSVSAGVDCRIPAAAKRLGRPRVDVLLDDHRESRPEPAGRRRWRRWPAVRRCRRPDGGNMAAQPVDRMLSCLVADAGSFDDTQPNWRVVRGLVDGSVDVRACLSRFQSAVPS